MTNRFLAQEEIDALLKKDEGAEEEESLEKDTGVSEKGEGAAGDGASTDSALAGDGSGVGADSSEADDALGEIEKDALGEIGNISMGSAATTLSQILDKEVRITSPKVSICTAQGLFARFTIPRLLVKVKFREGLSGYNLLIMKINDAAVLANLMMGGDGTNVSEELTEMEISAASEAMNQMIGTASTSLASMFQRAINIEPPVSIVLDTEDAVDYDDVVETDEVVMVEFRMLIKDLLDTQIMQIMSVETAKEKATLLLGGVANGGGGMASAATAEAVTAEAAAEAAMDALDAAAAEAAMDAEIAAGAETVAGREIDTADAEIAAAEAAMDAEIAAGGTVTGEFVEGKSAVITGESVVSVEGTHDAREALAAQAAAQVAHPAQTALGAHPAQTAPDAYAAQAAYAKQGALAHHSVQNSAQMPPAVPAASYDKQKIDLLLDIPLRVTVVLGRTRRPIKEVLGMTSGSIVELAALVDEPVEVQVNGTLVAKGEVVVVNENFGVRITEILSPTERLRQLKQ